MFLAARQDVVDMLVLNKGRSRQLHFKRLSTLNFLKQSKWSLFIHENEVKSGQLSFLAL